MPHITLEVTDDLIDQLDSKSVLAEIHRLLADPGGVPLSACKSRILVHDRWRSAEGSGGPGFLHLAVKILAKSETWKRSMGPALLEALRNAVDGAAADVQFTVHIDDSIARESYFKHPASGAFAPGAAASPSPEANRRAVLQAFEVKAQNGSNQPLIDLFAEDLVWTIHGSGALCRRYEGREDFVGNCLKVLAARIDGSIRAEVQHCLAEGDRVVLLWKGRGRTIWGDPYHNDYCWIFRFEEGRIAEGSAYIDTHLLDRVMNHPLP